MSKLTSAILGAAIGIMAAAPLLAADAPRTEAWSDAQVRAAMDKCKGLSGSERAKCTVNIRPAGGGGSSVATSVSDEKVVTQGVGSDEEFTAAMKRCDSAEANARDRCIADVKDHFGRM
ncbi:MAG: hypothetical protein ABI771_08155 [Betaproteobacteria bacterium]